MSQEGVGQYDRRWGFDSVIIASIARTVWLRYQTVTFYSIARLNEGHQRSPVDTAKRPLRLCFHDGNVPDAASLAAVRSTVNRSPATSFVIRANIDLNRLPYVRDGIVVLAKHGQFLAFLQTFAY